MLTKPTAKRDGNVCNGFMRNCDACGVGLGTTEYIGGNYEHGYQGVKIRVGSATYELCEDCKKDYESGFVNLKSWYIFHSKGERRNETKIS